MARKKSRYKQGKFKPINPGKYIGDPTNITYRSGWELKMLKMLDTSDSVKGYASEEVVIPYLSPIDNKVHRYFVDMLVVSQSNQVTLIEIKPDAQTRPPKGNKNKQRLIQESMTYLVNQAKWKAAEAYCQKKGWLFKVVTEKTLNFT